ncbi:hypothetical protein DVH24_034297 [Malus domestica]|uniref:Uncharacterized protein n=1 Tax=Malus domestica TaxID=3750 RepID=A0A498IYH2_MALDO|nr:hypothetical protein DVH24_034297 [Malus domestica]
MSRLITRRRSVTNAPPALSPSIAPVVSAPLIGEPTPFTEATATTSQVPLSSTSSVSVQFLNARRPHRRRRDSESSIHSSSSSGARMGAPLQDPGRQDEYDSTGLSDVRSSNPDAIT